MPLYPAIDNVITNLGNDIPNSIETLPRHLVNGTFTLPTSTTQSNLYLTYFTAPITLTFSNFVIPCQTAEVYGTSPHFQMAIYTIDGSGNLTGAAATSDQTNTVLTSAGTLYTIPLTAGIFTSSPSSYQVTRGTRYAVGINFFGGTTSSTAGKIAANQLGGNFMATAPRCAAGLTTTSTIVATIASSLTAASLQTSAVYFYVQLV